MDYFLGFDGGGTKTECVLLGSSPTVLASGMAGPSNPLRVGFAKTKLALCDAARQALPRRLKLREITGVCAGLAGAGRPRVVRRIEVILRELFPKACVSVLTDLEIALEAAAGAGQGIVLLAGTGSAAFGRNSSGRAARVGGWGPWIGDEGSAFDIGRRALAAVFRARERRGSATELTGRVLSAFGCRDWDELIERSARQPDEIFPKMFPEVAEEAAAGDAASREILTSAASSLAELVRSLVEALDLSAEAFVLAKAGGVFGRSAILDGALDQELKRIAPRARIGSLRISPAQAAAERARREFGRRSNASR